jgi:hypothetical protein
VMFCKRKAQGQKVHSNNTFQSPSSSPDVFE